MVDTFYNCVADMIKSSESVTFYVSEFFSGVFNTFHNKPGTYFMLTVKNIEVSSTTDICGNSVIVFCTR